MATNEAEAWAVIADPTRRLIIESLGRAPRSVGELAAELPVTRPAVSQHLKVLKDAGLVHDQALGTRRVYSLDAARLARFRRELDRFWQSALTRYASSADQTPKDQEPTDHQPADDEPTDHQPTDHQPTDHQPTDHESEAT